MNWDSIAFDWNQVRAFLAAAEEGSLSAAARALHQTQPTLSRQVTGLEQSLTRDVVRARAPKAALDRCRARAARTRASYGRGGQPGLLGASGQSQAIEGRVCITATEMMATYLPPMLRKLREQAPGIVVEVVASDQVAIRREADIAIRHAHRGNPIL
jgi:DNA-binding transcriptional LysR family regulator